MDCIFCKIAKGEIPTEAIYEDDKIIAFHDTAPQAPIHFLVIPKAHIESLNEVDEENAGVIADIFRRISLIAKEMGFDETGYRVVNNCGDDGNQTVRHLHFHVLAKRKMSWPPG
jgi:histidine triad (HIT) family protein